MRSLWRWLLGVSNYILHFRLDFLRFGAATCIQLDDDSLLEIFRLVSPEDRLQLSMVCHRFRTLLMPALFGKQVWAPWSTWRGRHRPFPPAYLRAHINVLILQGNESNDLISAERRTDVVSQLQIAIPDLTSTHTFVISGITGGLWPQLLETVAAAPAMHTLAMDCCQWTSEGQDIFGFPPKLMIKPLRGVKYDAPYITSPIPQATTRFDDPIICSKQRSKICVPS
ncbi:hypothetical protein B0H10DRAFT_657407 [Mycena sp. CBHHK59/15]|nr:hypothetical protein B0H10DRAFT_657407 [Mycena sp. CBHHK59/15]